MLRSLDRNNQIALKSFQEQKFSNELIEAFKNTLVTVKGDKGDKPIKGKDYDDGKDGISVKSGVVNEKGHLIITMSDDKKIDCGLVVGKKGDDAVFDEDKLLKKFLSQIKFPVPEKIDTKAVVAEAVEKAVKLFPKIKEPESIEEIVAKIKALPKGKRLKFSDLEEVPDFENIVKQMTAHLRSSSGGGVNALSLMTDVDIPKQPVNGMVLAYDATKQRFTLQTPTGGSGLPNGGTLGQVLTKKSATDGDADWEDPTGGGGVILNLDGGVPSSTYGTLSPIDGGGV